MRVPAQRERVRDRRDPGLLLFLIATLSFEDEMIPVRHLGGHSPGFFRFKQESVLSDNIQQLPQVPDLIVDPQVLWPGLSSRIVPAAGKSGIVGALDVCGEGVSDHETVLRRQAGYAGADIGIISRSGLEAPASSEIKASVMRAANTLPCRRLRWTEATALVTMYSLCPRRTSSRRPPSA